MGINYKQTNIHWNYFLAIESDFERISRYIEFTRANDNTFSIELARIIMSSSQEIDGVMKKLCALISPGAKPSNINGYKGIIKANLPDFITERVQMPRFGMDSRPWISWRKDDDKNNPLWWEANNTIKHTRTENFEEANLKNAFNSVGALLITTLYYYKYEIQTQNGEDITWQTLTTLLKPKTSLFILSDEYYHELGTWSSAEW